MKEVSINKNMKLSEHFTLGELTKTSYYTTDGNIPSRVAIENLKKLPHRTGEGVSYLSGHRDDAYSRAAALSF